MGKVGLEFRLGYKNGASVLSIGEDTEYMQKLVVRNLDELRYILSLVDNGSYGEYHVRLCALSSDRYDIKINGNKIKIVDRLSDDVNDICISLDDISSLIDCLNAAK